MYRIIKLLLGAGCLRGLFISTGPLTNGGLATGPFGRIMGPRKGGIGGIICGVPIIPRGNGCLICFLNNINMASKLYTQIAYVRLSLLFLLT